MNRTDSVKLLRNYAEHGDDAAFRELVEQYVDFVYSTAARRLGGDANLAEDVTQRVFAELALKARTLHKLEYLGGWLHRQTNFVASNILRSEQRRQVREQEAAQMNAISESTESPDSLWDQLEPLLDDSIERLEPPDRQAILLRFFERRDFRSIGNALGISDDAAQKRVSRAIEKLRSLLVQRGVTLSVVLLSSLLAGRVINAAPVGLAGVAAKFALAGTVGAAGGGLVPLLAKLSKSVALKLVLGGIVIATALWLARRNSSTSETADRQANAVQFAVDSTNGPAASNELGETIKIAPAIDTASANAASRVLVIKVVAADSGKPIPDVEFGCWLWANGDMKYMQLHATRFGVCAVPVPENTSELTLISGRDGFADTQLDWHVDRGEQIPTKYTLQLARAVPIGGSVLDPDGNPVAGAVLRFYNRPDAGLQTRPQSDDFRGSFLTAAMTDSQGHWEFNRVGAEALKTIAGSARYRDYVGTQIISLGRSTGTETQLLAETYVFKLGRAVVVHGSVKDPEGRPVPNADVLVGRSDMANSRQGKSRADGTFSIVGCEPGKNMITAQAEGFAATKIDVNLTDNSRPFELTLHPGQLLKLRVVDENGNSVPNANVRFDSWVESSWEREPAQVDFQERTDANGRVQWENAPDGVLKFSILANGYMNGTRNFECRADGTEHTITLQPGLTISGTVNDAETGKVVPHFRILAGSQSYDPYGNTKHFSWSADDSFLLSFSGGSFQYTWTTLPFGAGEKDPWSVFKFEADGYAPYITRAIYFSERNVHLEVALKPAPAIDVAVLSPHGEPAADAEIGFASWAGQLKLVPGGLSHSDVQCGGTFLAADSTGHFALPPDPSVTQIIAASPQGYAETTPAELATNPVVQLQAWGRLDGMVLTNGQAAAGSTVTFQDEHAGSDPDTVPLESIAFNTKADNAGRFTFGRVPAGDFTVTLLLPIHDITGDSVWIQGPARAVTIKPGETTTVTIEATNKRSEFAKQ